MRWREVSGILWLDAKRSLSVDFREDFDHGGSGPGRFDAPVHLVSEAANMSLCLVFHEKDLMNDRSPVIKRELLKGICNITGDQVGMGGVPPDDNSKGNDADGLLKFK